jgi:type VI secretion system protein ImpG
MDPRLLRYYNQELQYMREMGGEFAKAYPKIASRLSLDEFECADPYVERLLEGFSFLAARIQLKLDEEFPRFTQHLLERVYPHYLRPTPSMALVQLQPDLLEPSLAEGFLLPRHSVLRSRSGRESPTACIYRTAQDVTLWPLTLQSADYLPSPAAIAMAGIGRLEQAKAAVRLRFASGGELSMESLPIDRLALHLSGGESGMLAFEALAGHTLCLIGRAPESLTYRKTTLPDPVRIMGFEPGESLLPYGSSSFQGYRLLAEYFAMPERFMFIELVDLRQIFGHCKGTELELFFLLDQGYPELEGTLSEENFLLNCAPTINLFAKRADRIHLNDGEGEYHLLPDRSRPLDYEVYSVTEVKGFGSNTEQSQRFEPFYAASDLTADEQPQAYYSLQRQPRVVSSKQQREGQRSAYIGSEVFVSIVDSEAAPYRSELRQLSVNTLCSNRDLPLLMPLGQGSAAFSLDSSTPVKQIRCIGSPTRPRPPAAVGAISWRLVNHLSLNYLSLAGEDQAKSTAALKELLQLYADTSEPALRKQVDGVVSISSRPVQRRMPSPGPISFGRGLEITLTLDEAAFQGVGSFLFGAVMEQFFRKYTAINAFTETVIATLQRGEVMRWPVRLGLRHTL